MGKKIGLIVGSLRKESFNKKVANILMNTIVDKSENIYQIIEIEQLPFYNQDFDTEGAPSTVDAFREEITQHDAFIFLTPEYNRSIPAVLKNALDVASRPYGKSVWNGKPAAVVSVSIGAIGGFGANHHLRQCLTFLNMPPLQQPEMYIGNIAQLLNEDGTSFKEQQTVELFEKFIDAFEGWIEKF